MPNPSQVSAQNINTELGVGTTTTLSLGNNWVRNVTTQTTGSVDYGKARWGINFPGGALISGGDYFKTYGGGLGNLPNTYFYMLASDVGFGTASSNTILTLYSNGVMKLEVNTLSSATQNVHHVTWLTSGVNSDYTAQLKVNDAVAIGGAALNTDLVLSTTREWSSGAASGGGAASNYADCELIIKDSGGTLISRPIYFESFAEAF